MYTVRVTIWDGAVEELEVQFPCKDLYEIKSSLRELGHRIESGDEPFNSYFDLTEEDEEDLQHAEALYRNGVFDA